MCSVYLKDSEKVVSISSEHLEPITPTKNNKVGARPGPRGGGVRLLTWSRDTMPTAPR
jgi:hypothetical protein